MGRGAAWYTRARPSSALTPFAGQAAIAIDNARLYQQAQQSIRARDEFLAAAAQDLRTPLAAVRGYAQLLERHVTRAVIPLDGRWRASLTQIKEAAGQMSKQIEELLDLGRLQLGGMLVLDCQHTDLAALARQDDAGGACAVLTVQDQEAGIPAPDLPRIFERSHLGSNVAGHADGTGIGLATARQ